MNNKSLLKRGRDLCEKEGAVKTPTDHIHGWIFGGSMLIGFFSPWLKLPVKSQSFLVKAQLHSQQCQPAPSLPHVHVPA